MSGSTRANGAIRIVAVGRGRARPLGEAADDFLERSRRFADARLERVKASRARRRADRLREEAAALDARLGAGPAVALDARGRRLDSDAFRDALARWRERGGVTLLVGGPDGLDDALRDRCDAVVSLGPLTMSHELALAVLLEQVYRALASQAGHPYARH